MRESMNVCLSVCVCVCARLCVCVCVCVCMCVGVCARARARASERARVRMCVNGWAHGIWGCVYECACVSEGGGWVGENRVWGPVDVSVFVFLFFLTFLRMYVHVIFP